MNQGHPTEDRLHDLLDDQLSVVERERVERHLESCVRCRAEVEQLRGLLERARELRPLRPPRDLWPAVRTEIERGSRPARGWLLAAAAAAIVTTVVLIGVGGFGPAEETPVAGSWLEEVFRAEAEYEQASLTLRQSLDQREDRLPPGTRVVFEENLEIIDEAIADVRRALRSGADDPANGHRLTALHQKKMQLLWRASRLSS